MPSSTLCRILPVLALGAAVAVLAVPAPCAAMPLLGAPSEASLAATTPGDLLAAVWGWIEARFLPAGGPWGRSAPRHSGRPAFPPDLNCTIDPNGMTHCTDGAQALPAAANLNCGLDPNGRPICAGGAPAVQPSTDLNCGIDPNGRPICTGGAHAFPSWRGRG